MERLLRAKTYTLLTLKMNKATLGMILLGAVVFTKAFLIERSDENVVSRDTELSSSIEENTSLRISETKFIEPRAELMAFNLVSPKVMVEEPVINQPLESPLTTEITEDDLMASVDITEEVVDEVIPMDVVTNTGYGMWISSSEKITSKEDRNGKVPLDRGNTISDNISKLFPRIP